MKAGALVEHYQDNMVNPTFSLGIYSFPNLSAFLRNVPNNFVGLTPAAQFDRYWRFTLFGFYVQDEFRVTPRLTLNGGLRYEFTTMPEDIYGRDSSLPDLIRVAANRRAVVRESDVHEPFASASARRGTSSATARQPSAAVTASTSTRPTSRT